MSGLIPRPSPLGFDRAMWTHEAMVWRRPGSVGRVFQSTAVRGRRVGSQPPFLFSLRGFGFGCRDCTRREDYDMDFDTVRDAAANESAEQRRRMEVSTTGAAQR